MLRSVQFQVRAVAVIVLALTAGACDDTVTPTSPIEDDAPLSHVIMCRADVANSTVSCRGLKGDTAAPGLSVSIVGGQGTYVQLASANVSYASGVFGADVTVKNLIAQPMGTPDGTTVTGIKVFFHSGPTVTSSNGGTVEVSNYDGTGTFTASQPQPYFEYNTILQTDQVSSAKRWQWTVTPEVETFEFSVYVSTDIPVVTGNWEGVPTPAFGTVDFTVDAQSSAIIQFQFNVDNHLCGSVVVTGAGGGIDIWPISDQQFNIDHTDPSGHRYVLNGIFGPRGGQASGTWGLTVSGNTCSGTWQGTPRSHSGTSLSGKIVFSHLIGVVNHGVGLWGIFAMSPYGSVATAVVPYVSEGKPMTPAGSPDGQWVAYQVREVLGVGWATTTAYVARADGTGAYELMGFPSGTPSWSPDGSRIALWADDWLTVVNPDGSNVVQLVECPFICEQAEPLLSPQAWSANGDSVYFSLIPDVNGIRPREIYAVSVADSGLRRILYTDHPNRDITEGFWDPAISVFGEVAFTSDYWTGNPDIYVLYPDGSIYSISHMSSAADYNSVWSPDGSRLAFVSDRDGSPKIYVLEGSAIRQLTAHSNADTDPHWVPGPQTAPAKLSSAGTRAGLIRATVRHPDHTRPRR